MAAGASGSGSGAGAGRAPELTAFQMEVARLFFALPESEGFLLAGGAALLAQHLTARSTQDLDFFTAAERGHVSTARDALEAAAGGGLGELPVRSSRTDSAERDFRYDLAPCLAPSVEPHHKTAGQRRAVP
jgi:hypothetical protein